jgi:hypothetical protein
LVINVPTFKGMMNAVASRLIGETQAVTAKNCVTRNGNLTPLYDNSAAGSPELESNSKSLFLYQGEHWFSWAQDVNAVNSPIAQDDYQRVYFTGDGVPKYTNSSIATGTGALPFASYELGIDSPPVFNVAAIYYDQSADLDAEDSASNYDIEAASGYINTTTEDDETRFYVCTYVSAYGEEGPPSTVSSVLELFCEDDTVTLTFSDVSGFGNKNITKRRIYRTATSDDSTEFYFVAEIPVTDTTYEDSLLAYELGALLATDDYDPPPDDMEGLIMTSTGIAIGFADNSIIPSEPYLPYAFPTGYRQSLPDNVVGLVEMSSGIVIATDNKPAIMQGSLPDSFTLTVLDAALPCIAKYSVVDMGEAAIYASHEGLVSVSSDGAQVITRNILSKSYWQSLNPSTIRAYRYLDYYVGFYDETAGFVFDLRTGDFFEIDFYATAGYFDSPSGKLYLIVDDVFVTFDSGQALSYTWESKTFDLNNSKFSCVKVRGQSLDNTTFELLVDGVSEMTLALSGADQMFRLPAFRARRLTFKLTGSDEIESITIAQSVEELRVG